MKRSAALLSLTASLTFILMTASGSTSASKYKVGLPRPSAALTPTVISGATRNGTAGASLPPELVVSVVQLDAQGNEAERRQTSTEADGSFRIDGLEEDRGRRFLVATDYLGVTYSTLVENPPESPGTSADLTVYETTEDDSVVRISSDVTTIAKGSDDTFEVIQLLRVENVSDRTFVGREGELGRTVLRLPVPQGGFDFLPLEGVTIQGLGTEPGAVTTADPVLPGETSISYLYKARISRNAWAFRRSIFYPTARADLLVEKGVELEAPAFTFEEEITLDDRTYRRFRSRSFQSGEFLELNIALAQTPQGGYLWWGLGGGLLLVILAGVSSVMARQKRREVTRADERERMIEEIADLDERFEAGSLPEAEYSETRERLKERLKSLTDELAAKRP
jgi:hypothetical protein